MGNPWRKMTAEEGRVFDEIKEEGPFKCRTVLQREILWKVIKKYLPDDRTVPILDLGGGTGVWSIRLAMEKYSAILTDISPGILKLAKEKIDKEGLSDKITIEQTDICDLRKYKERSFPLVLALGDPLSYCGNAAKALRAIKRITKEKGILIGDVENRYKMLDGRRASNWEDARRILNEGTAFWPDSKNPAPIRQFTPSELGDLLKAAGWQLIDMYPSHLIWSLLGKELLQQGLASKKGFQDVVVLEEKLRKDKHLLGCGFEIQFIAVNSD